MTEKKSFKPLEVQIYLMVAPFLETRRIHFAAQFFYEGWANTKLKRILFSLPVRLQYALSHL